MRNLQTAGVISKPSILYRAPQTAAQEAQIKAREKARKEAYNEAHKKEVLSSIKTPVSLAGLSPAQIAQLKARNPNINIESSEYVAAPSTNPDLNRRVIEDSNNKKIIANIANGTATEYERNIYKFGLSSGKIHKKDAAISVVKVAPPVAAAAATTATAKPEVAGNQKTTTGTKPVTRNKKAVVSVDERIKRIQRSLGVEVDGMWGKETQAAYMAMKKTQEGLGLKQDGIRGKDTTQAIYDRDMLAVNSAREMKVPTTIDQAANNNIVITQPSRTPREMRKEARIARRQLRILDKTNGEEYAAMRRGGLLYKK